MVIQTVPAVTREEFERITCNRCGDCCERFYLSESMFDPNLQFRDQDKTLRWLAEVIPIGPVVESGDWKGRTYRCPRFIRDPETGAGICTDYANRPHICADFPYGKPVEDEALSRCAWTVRLIDAPEIEH